jgi:hypothetical protein
LLPNLARDAGGHRYPEVVGPAEFFAKHSREGVVGALATVFFGVFEADHAQRAHLREHVVEWNLAVSFPLIDVGVDLGLYERAHHGAEGIVFFGETHGFSVAKLVIVNNSERGLTSRYL